MQDMPTFELENKLKEMKTSDLGDYYKENKAQMADEKKGFYYYMKETIENKGILLKDVYSFAGGSESYGSQILRMEKHTKDRDLILRLCIAGHLSVDETNRALKLYGMSPLYAKDKRDANLIILISNRVFDLAAIDDSLERHGFSKLSTDGTK